jgi:hypothetical protein
LEGRGDYWNACFPFDLYEQVVVIFISEHVPLPRNFLDRRMEKGIIPFMPWVILI